MSSAALFARRYGRIPLASTEGSLSSPVHQGGLVATALDLESQKGARVLALASASSVGLGQPELLWALIAFLYAEVRC